LDLRQTSRASTRTEPLQKSPNDKNFCTGSQGDAGYVKLSNPEIDAGGAATTVTGTSLSA